MIINIVIDTDSKGLLITVEPKNSKIPFALQQDIVYSIEKALLKDFIEIKPIYWGDNIEIPIIIGI